MACWSRTARVRLSLRFLGVVALVARAGDANATVLVFDQMRSLGEVVPTISGNDPPQDYGDRVLGPTQSVPGGTFTYGEAGEGFTPNVVVEYYSMAPGGASDTSLWQDSYGDLTNIVLGNQDSGTLNTYLTADEGYEALLYGFDLGGWPERDYTISAVRVLDGGAPLFSQSDVLVEGDFDGPRHTSFDFDTPLAGAALHIEIDYSNLPGAQQDNIGIDNIRFGQAPPGIPEPATVLLVGSVLLWNVTSRRQLANGQR